MRVRYLVQLKEPIRLEDHWPISIMGGGLKVVSNNGMASAFEITFTGQSVELAPKAEQTGDGDVALSITMRDSLLPFVRTQLEKAFTYLMCYFDLALLIEEIGIKYEGETPDKEKQIAVKGYSSRRDKPQLSIPYDLLPRAIMAAETGQAPEFEATLVSAARTAMLEERYIDSFRYAFLLIESLYGDEKFKTEQQKVTLKKNADFVPLVAKSIKNCMRPKRLRNSDTERLLAASPTPDAVIDHLVDKRGFYFYGNVKRKHAWRPHEQEAAEALALLSLEIVLLISHAAAAPIFDDAFSKRHSDNAKRIGAIITMKVDFSYR